ncbi:serine protease [Leeia sp. TBRC 13508]|uniref:Serine protease n=1 Tax=Leeia speluncae TaxID=2884804 RepID=A0ABS8D834_9NEIS|nr:serine protease [Leeia speluncae]MCB6183798.1 serine protease [Leeia speluncae]
MIALFQRTKWIIWSIIVLIIGISAKTAVANEEPATEAVFANSRTKIAQIRILEKSSNAKASLGSGFIVSPQGLLITNYHVISDLVFRPDLYRGEVFFDDGESRPLKLVNFDVVHDLALLSTNKSSPQFFEINPAPQPKGSRVYAIGTPHDLGFTIVEGTYNGLLTGSLYEKIHYTGAINSGMSGGPAILPDGKVVGINVATAGNQIGFLIPSVYALRLIKRPPQTHPHPIEWLRQQLINNQSNIANTITKQPMQTANFHGYRVPVTLGDFSKCWADTDQPSGGVFERFSQQCSTEDDLFLYRDYSTGKLEFQHDFIRADKLSPLRFYNLYQQFFARPYDDMGGPPEDMGQFDCKTDFVNPNGLKMKLAFCVRPYKRLPGLYDMIVKLATLNQNHAGLISSYQVSGVSFMNARKLAYQYVGAFAWQK